MPDQHLESADGGREGGGDGRVECREGPERRDFCLRVLQSFADDRGPEAGSEAAAHDHWHESAGESCCLESQLRGEGRHGEEAGDRWS